MANSQIRKDWQDFKRKHPTFEKSKNFKSDVGPQLDKFDKARDEWAAMIVEMQKKAAEAAQIGKSTAAALKGYDAVVKELEATDKTIRKDFAAFNFDSFQQTYVDQYVRASTFYPKV